jgi:hypothetical protein
MNNLGKNLYYVLTILSIFSVAHAEEFTPVKFIQGSDRTFSTYPAAEARMARTARVWISYIVSKDGTVSEPMIEQINNDRFNKTVLKWMTYLNFEPATVDGEPIDSIVRGRRAFNIGYDQRSGRVSTTLFNKLNKQFGEEIAKPQPDQKRLKKLLEKLLKVRHGSSLAYEYISRRRYQFAEKFLDRDAQIYALRERILSNDRGVVRENGILIDQELIHLLLEAGYQGEALGAYVNARRKLNSSKRAQLWVLYGEKITQIRENIDSDVAFKRPISIGDNGYMFLPLLKRNFKFTSVEGEFNTIKLRCERQFAEFKFTAAAEYRTPENWGECQLQVLGTVGSNAQLTQL